MSVVVTVNGNNEEKKNELDELTCELMKKTMDEEFQTESNLRRRTDQMTTAYSILLVFMTGFLSIVSKRLLSVSPLCWSLLIAIELLMLIIFAFFLLFTQVKKRSGYDEPIEIYNGLHSAYPNGMSSEERVRMSMVILQDRYEKQTRRNKVIANLLYFFVICIFIVLLAYVGVASCSVFKILTFKVGA